MDYRTPRQKFLQRNTSLKSIRSSWDAKWRDLNDYIAPTRARFAGSDTNKGDRKDLSIVNNTATRAHRVLASGMMAGITSPARPWFKLTTPDPTLADKQSVREWLHQVETVMRAAFARSNIYQALFTLYQDLGQFGTHCMFLEEDAKDLLRAYSFPVGSYCLAANGRGQVDTMYREVSLSIGEMVHLFGLENLSPRLRDAVNRGNVDERREVLHVVEPNDSFRPGIMGPAGKRFRSVWLEMSCEEGHQGVLKVSGFDENPLIAPRWDVVGQDVYGRGPGEEIIGDAKTLQLYERRKAQAIELVVRPPMKAPAALAQQRASLLPGDFTYVPEVAGGQTLEPAYTVHPSAIPALRDAIRDHEYRINSGMMADLWLMVANAEGARKTATEVVQLNEEKMLQLGPVLERLNNEELDPLIDRAFAILLRGGHLPPPPPELEGVELRVEYMSIMATAQKMLGTSSMERGLSWVINLSSANPEVLDVVDFDQATQVYFDALGVSPDIIRSDEKIAEMRQARAQAQQQAAQEEQMAQAANTAKTLADTQLENPSALKQMLGGLGAPTGGAA